MLSPQTKSLLLSMHQQAGANAQSWAQKIQAAGQSTERHQNYVRNLITSQACMMALMADRAGLGVAEIRERLSLVGVLPETDHVEVEPETAEVTEDDLADVLAGLEAELGKDQG